MPDADLLFMPASKAAALIRARKLSPVDYVNSVLAAIERQQPRLNFFVTIMADQARAAAKQAEQAVMDHRSGDAPLGPLHGVPVTIKDLIDVAGIPTKMGSAIFADNVAAADDVMVTRLRNAGAIIIGKTTTPEFGNKGLTDGPSFGITRNPWNLDRTPGGSSGGAAAAVAAGCGPLGLGTDGAGSVRGPAACCGLVGHKPTLGAVPADGSKDSFGNNVYAGPLARTVTDAAIMHDILSGPTKADAWSQNGRDPWRVSPQLIGGDLTSVRIGYIAKCANPRVAADVEANTRASLDALAGLGADVEEVTDAIDWIELPGRVMYQAAFHVLAQDYLPKWQNQMDPVVLAFAERGSKFSLLDFRRAQFDRTALFRTIQGLFDRYDILITPTMTRTALPVGFDVANDSVEVDGVRTGITRQGWTSYLYPFNLTGHPALSIPSGFGTDGLPTAVQVIGPWGADTDVFRIGALLEQTRPWAQHRPRL